MSELLLLLLLLEYYCYINVIVIFMECCCSQKLLGARKEVADLPLVNKTMMYIGSRHSKGASRSGLIDS